MSDTTFAILAHDRPAQLHRLIDRLHPHDVFLHLDAKTRAEDFTDCVAGGRIHPVERVDVRWGGFSMVEATMKLLEAALAQPSTQRVILLSGACYPIRPVEDLVAAMNRGGGQALNYLPISEATPHLVETIQLRWFFDLERLPQGRTLRRAARYGCSFLLPRRGGPPGGLVPHFGSQWWSLTRPCAELVLDQYRNNRKLVDYYRRCFAPDEHFVQTIVANSQFRAPQHLISYKGQATFAQAPLHHIAATNADSGRRQGPKPAWLDVATELTTLRRSGKFFARKIRHEANLDLIDRELLGLR